MARDKPKQTDSSSNPRADQPRAEVPPDEAAAATTAAATDSIFTKQPETAGQTAATSQPPTDEPEPVAATTLQSLQAELQQAKDRALRCQAELENYRKRMQRQLEEERRYANLPLLRDLLPVFDNVHRAVEAGERAANGAGLLEGVRLVAQQLEGVLAKYNCVAVEALHEPFDPHQHEAISQQPSAEHPPNTVLGVTQTGFQLHDRVIRPSQVIVSKPTEQ